MQKNTTIVIVLASLAVGIIVGYSFSFKDSRYPGDKYKNRYGMHMMPDGRMMNNYDDSMSMASMMSDMNRALAGKTLDSFDEAFLLEMIVHHQGAVEMAELALKNAKHQEIRDLANAIIVAQKKEIGDMQSWLKNWYQR